MSSLFKKLSRGAIANRRLTRYLLYAFGEIALIVVGIGIALSVSKFSEKQKGLLQSNSFLHDMLEDLALDTLQLNKMLFEFEKKLQTEEWLINKKDFNQDDIDSIQLSVSPIKWSFKINDRSFENIQNIKGSKLIGYDKLYSEISKYYLTTKNRIDENNELEMQKSNQLDEFYNTITQNLYVNSREYQDYKGFSVKIKENKREVPDKNIKNVIASLSEIKTQNLINNKYARHNYIYLSLFVCNIEAKQLSKKITKALQQ